MIWLREIISQSDLAICSLQSEESKELRTSNPTRVQLYWWRPYRHPMANLEGKVANDACLKVREMRRKAMHRDGLWQQLNLLNGSWWKNFIAYCRDYGFASCIVHHCQFYRWRRKQETTSSTINLPRRSTKPTPGFQLRPKTSMLGNVFASVFTDSQRNILSHELQNFSKNTISEAAR